MGWMGWDHLKKGSRLDSKRGVRKQKQRQNVKNQSEGENEARIEKLGGKPE